MLSSTDGGNKMCTWSLLENDTAHLYFEFPKYMKNFSEGNAFMTGGKQVPSL